MGKAPILIALDDPGFYEEAVELITKSCGLVAGYKIGIPLVIGSGVEGVGTLVEKCPGALWVADLKLADIGHVMSLTAGLLLPFFQAFIAHSFVGSSGALLELKQHLESKARRLVLVYSMSHPGAREVYTACLEKIDRVVERVRPWGLVVGATTPQLIERARRLYPSAAILSPGVGVQGAEPGEAICRGADYEIIGRSITRAPNPLQALRDLIRRQERRILQCRRRNAAYSAT